MLLLMLALLQNPTVDAAFVNARVELAIESSKKKPTYLEMRKQAIDSKLPLIVCVKAQGKSTSGCLICFVETFALGDKKIDKGFIISRPHGDDLYYVKTVQSWDEVLEYLKPPSRPQVKFPVVGNCLT
jgi:hypothetical protein